jgi:hypothetical protein
MYAQANRYCNGPTPQELSFIDPTVRRHGPYGRPVANGCNDDTVAQASQVDVTLDAGTYFVVVQGCGLGRGGDYTLDVAVVPP